MNMSIIKSKLQTLQAGLGLLEIGSMLSIKDHVRSVKNMIGGSEWAIRMSKT